MHLVTSSFDDVERGAPFQARSDTHDHEDHISLYVFIYFILFFSARPTQWPEGGHRPMGRAHPTDFIWLFFIQKILFGYFFVPRW